MNNEAKHMAGAVEGFIAGIAAMITMRFGILVAIATLNCRACASLGATRKARQTGQ